jgi:hypothetical protein
MITTTLEKIATLFVDLLDLFVWVAGVIIITKGASLRMGLQGILNAAPEVMKVLCAHVQPSLAQRAK